MLSSDSDSEVESLQTFTINEHYAKAFEYKKEREELFKLKEKYGSDFEDNEDEDETDSESDEDEDEDGEELTPAVDVAILRTLARIRRKDPDIYNTDKNIFGEEQQKIAPIAKPSRVPRDKSKPVTMRQVVLDSALNLDSRSPSPEPLTHVEEQQALRNETIAAFHQGMEGDDHDDDDLLVPREKTKDEQEVEDEEYQTFLEREVGEDLRVLVTGDSETNNTREDKKNLQAINAKDVKKKVKKGKKAEDENTSDYHHSKRSKEESDQEFLMNYILGRGWVDRSVNRIPTYGEITSSKPQSKGKIMKDFPIANLESLENDTQGLPTADPELDEEDFDDIVDRFEISYNFRFEEPGAAVIQSYPRNIPSLARREDTTRKDARERRKKRKEEEIKTRKEEVKRLKTLKMKEIKSKLERIGREGGKSLDKDEALQSLDLEGEWDPDTHDRQMAGLYGNDDFSDDEKPQWDDDIDIGDIVEEVQIEEPKKKKKKKKKKGNEDEADIGIDIDAMDADVEKLVDDDEWDGTEEMRKRKLDEYMNEIYGLDFNDIVGDMPTRFKYVPVQPENFALTPVEILLATDQELNEYMSVKKYAPYRKEFKWDSKRGERLNELKKRLSERGPNGFFAGGSRDDVHVNDKPIKKRKGKKERMRLKSGDGTRPKSPIPITPEVPLQKRKRDASEAGDDASGETRGISGKKRRKRKHKEVGEAGAGV